MLQREVSHFATAREFLFKHALLRDVAYDGVLRAHRERYHRRAAAWLAETSSAVGRADEYAADIADHYDRAHDPAASVWYLRAGTRAASVYALTEASRMLDSALKHAPEGDTHLRFDILLAQEDLLDRRGEREPQQRALDAMTALAEHLDPPRQVQLELAQSRFQFSHSEYDTARLHADRAVEIATEIDDLALRAESTLAQGKALTWAAEGEGAHVCLTRAVELAREIGRPALIGEGLRYLAMLTSNNGDFPASLEYAAEAREVFARAGDTELESTALAQGANTYFNLGRYAEAQAALEETLPIFRRSGHRYRETINLGNLASIALMRGQLASAEQWGREAVENAHQLEELEAEANYLLVLGAVATLTSRFDVARSHLDDAISIAHDVHEDALQGETLARMSTVELATGNLDEALALGRRAVTAAADVASDLDRGTTQQAHAHAAAAMGLWDEAETAFAEAHRLFKILELDSLVRETTVGLASVAAARGQVDAAVELIAPVLEHLDTAGLAQTWEPGEMLVCCHRILVEAGDPRAGVVLEQARNYLRAMAEEVGRPGPRGRLPCLPAARCAARAGLTGPLATRSAGRSAGREQHRPVVHHGEHEAGLRPSGASPARRHHRRPSTRSSSKLSENEPPRPTALPTASSARGRRFFPACSSSSKWATTRRVRFGCIAIASPASGVTPPASCTRRSASAWASSSARDMARSSQAKSLPQSIALVGSPRRPAMSETPSTDANELASPAATRAAFSAKPPSSLETTRPWSSSRVTYCSSGEIVGSISGIRSAPPTQTPSSSLGFL